MFKRILQTNSKLYLGQQYSLKALNSFKFLNGSLALKVNKNKFSTNTNTSLEKYNDTLSFRQFSFIPEIYTVLDRLKIVAPTSIQSVAIPRILDKKHTFFTAQTGTGKSFCYILPILHDLKLTEQIQKERLTLQKRPRVLIVVPTRELAVQVEEVIKMFIYEVPLKVEAFYVGRKYNSEVKCSEEGIDILITTPERFQNHWEKGNVYSTKLSHLVIDELDTLLDGGNEEFIKTIMESFLKPTKDNITKQVILCSATTTKHINTFIKGNFPDDQNFVQIIDRSTNVNLSNIKHEFIHVTDYDKYPTLLKILSEYRKYLTLNFSLILFCNSINCARKTELFLSENGIYY